MSAICVLAIVPSQKGAAPASCSCRLPRNATVQQAIGQISLQTQLPLNVHDIVINGSLFTGDRSSTELATVCDGPALVILLEEKRSRSVPEPATVGNAVMYQKRDFAPELLARFEPTQLEQHQKMMMLHQQRMGSVDSATPAVARRAPSGSHIGQPPPPLRESAQPSSQLLRNLSGGSPRNLSGGSPRVSESLVNEENIMSLAHLGISREDAVRALTSAASVDAAASIAMSTILNEDDVPRPRRASSAPSSLGSAVPSPPSQTAVWDRTLRCIAIAAQGNTFAQEVLMCFRVPMMLMNNLSIASALPHIFQGERRLGNIANWERSSAANDAMLQAIEYCRILDANPSAVPVPPSGYDPDVWEDSILLGRPSDPSLDKFFADSKQQISQVCFVVTFPYSSNSASACICR